MFDTIVTEKDLKFNELENKIFKFVCMLGCLILKKILERQDKKLLETLDKSRYRNKGLRQTTVKTIMGEVEYRRRIYGVLDNYGNIIDYVYLLDEVMKINKTYFFSQNITEKVLEAVANTTSYRKAADTIAGTTGGTISHEMARKITIKTGEKIEQKEKEIVELHKEEKLISQAKVVNALFEEADGLWLNLQGKDRKEHIKKLEAKAKKENKEFKMPSRVKSEIKLHMTYEGCKNDKRHTLVNKMYTVGFMKSKELKEIKEAKIFQKYDIDKIQLRVLNGDGATWIRNIQGKKTIYQLDCLHIHQAITRKVPKEYRPGINILLDNKDYNLINEYLEAVKYDSGGEEKIVKKLIHLQEYFKVGLPRYTDLVDTIPEAPEGMIYNELGTMESQIFTVLSQRLNSGRKAFSKKGATYLGKVCAFKVESSIEELFKELETPIAIDNSVEEWIKEIELNVEQMKETKNHERHEVVAYRKGHLLGNKNIQQILELKPFSKLVYR
jgi:peptide methionine sulfoxide reductase MsrA